MRIAPLSVRPQDFHNAVVSRDPVQAAAVAVALVAFSGPDALLAYLETTLQRELRQMGDVTATEFTAVALEMMPHNFRRVIGAKVCVDACTESGHVCVCV